MLVDEVATESTAQHKRGRAVALYRCQHQHEHCSHKEIAGECVHNNQHESSKQKHGLPPTVALLVRRGQHDGNWMCSVVVVVVVATRRM